MSAAPAAPTPSLPFELQAGERVLDLRRRHWWFLWPRTILWLVIAVVPLIVIAWLAASYDLGGAGPVLAVLVVLWVLFWAVRLFLNWYVYHHDIWVVTNQRLVDCFKANPFSSRIATADLVNMQDITVNKQGVVATFLDFGNVLCQTAGASEQFVISGVPDPEAVQHLIDRERDRERQANA